MSLSFTQKTPTATPTQIRAHTHTDTLVSSIHPHIQMTRAQSATAAQAAAAVAAADRDAFLARTRNVNRALSLIMQLPARIENRIILHLLFHSLCTLSHSHTQIWLKQNQQKWSNLAHTVAHSTHTHTHRYKLQQQKAAPAHGHTHTHTYSRASCLLLCVWLHLPATASAAAATAAAAANIWKKLAFSVVISTLSIHRHFTMRQQWGERAKCDTFFVVSKKYKKKLCENINTHVYENANSSDF